jgi:diguanylate cyclase (GGDEF)-like protein
VGLTSAILLALSLDVIERLHRVAVTDVLTGILNRRGFEEECLRLTKRLQGRSPLSLIMIDLDHFKKINDTHGHETGDLVITRMAALLSREAGPDGCAGRLGGEEFAVLLSARALAESVARANEIRQTFARMTWPFDTSWVHPTASFGVTTVLADEPYASFIARADTLLYLAKRAGRDCVMYGDSESHALLPRNGEPALVN